MGHTTVFNHNGSRIRIWVPEADEVTVKLVLRHGNKEETELRFSDQEQFVDFNWNNFEHGDPVYIADGQHIGDFYDRHENEVRLIKYI